MDEDKINLESLTLLFPTGPWGASVYFGNSMPMGDDGTWHPALPAPSGVADMGSQAARAGIGPAQASHEQRRPTSSEDTNPLRQHDEGPLQTEDRLGKSSSAFFGPHLACMYCATPRRGLLGEKQARR